LGASHLDSLKTRGNFTRWFPRRGGAYFISSKNQRTGKALMDAAFATWRAVSCVTTSLLKHFHSVYLPVTRRALAEPLEVRTLLSTAPVPFQLNSSYSTGAAPADVIAADVNGDGKMDAITVLPGSNAISISLGTGHGGFGSPTLFSVGSNPVWAAVGDFNGDGHVDVVTANSGDNTVSVLLGDGHGGFAPAVIGGVATSDYSLGASPQFVVVGDFNSDGKLDIATANYAGVQSSAPILSILLGNGNGTFQAPLESRVNPEFWAYASSLAVGDFNGDGKPDLAIGNPYDDQVMIALGNGNGTFTYSSTLLASTPTMVAGPDGLAGSVCSADFNGDGHADLAIADTYSGSVIIVGVWLGNGNGTFGSESLYYAGEEPGSISASDLNGDGKPDLIVTNGDYNGLVGTKESGGVSVLLNNGDGTFQPSTAFATGDGPSAVAVADFNGDGTKDLLIADSASNDISLDLGYGDGTFSAPKDFLVFAPPTNENPSNPMVMPQEISASGDINGDGYKDIVTADDNGYDVGDISVLLSNGDGTFADAVKVPAGNGVRGVAVGDFDGDGKADVAVVNSTDNDITVFRDWSDGGFLHQATYALAGSATSIVAVDLNGDGKLDLAVSLWSTGTVQVFLNNGDGTFASPMSFADAGGASMIAAGDFNGDGKQDLVTTSWPGNDMSILLNQGMSGGQWQGLGSPIIAPNAGNPYAITVGDFNGDGKLDVATRTESSNGTTYEVDVWLGNGDGTLQSRIQYTGLSGSSEGLVAADINGDGETDLISANGASQTASIYLNKGSSNGSWLGFASPETVALGSDTMAVTVGDFNRDGKEDLVTANQLDANISVLLQDSPPTASAGGPYTVVEGSSVTLIASASGDDGNRGLSYEWDIEYDGSTFNPMAVGTAATFDPLTLAVSPGTYTVAVQVTDLAGASVISTATVTVLPQVTISGSSTIAAGSPFSLALSANDLNGQTISSWSISWGDGTHDNIPYDASTASHSYGYSTMAYTVTATATTTSGTTYTAQPWTINLGYGTQGISLPGGLTALGSAVQPDNKLLVAGIGQSVFAVGRFDSDGQADTTFGPNDNGIVSTNFQSQVDEAKYVAVQNSDGDIVAGGIGANTLVLARYDSFGNSDLNFGTNHNGTVLSALTSAVPAGMALDPSENILLAGSTIGNWEVERFTPAGLPDSANFGTSGGVVSETVPATATLDSMALLISGQILLAGDSPTGLTLMRFNSDGTLDHSYGTAGILTLPPSDNFTHVNLLVRPQDGDVVVTGSSGVDFYIALLTPDGLPVSGAAAASFGTNGLVTAAMGSFATARASTLLSDGEIVVVGSSSSGDAIAYKPDGTPDTNAGANGMLPLRLGNITTIAVQPNGTVDFVAVNSTHTQYIGDNQLQVTPIPPTVTISGADSAAARAVYQLSLSAVYAPENIPDALITSWTIDWGDAPNGGPDLQTMYGNPSTVSHYFQSEGDYGITATATDINGTYDALGGQPLEVSVTDTGPLAIIGPAVAQAGSTLMLYATGGINPANTSMPTYVWAIAMNGATITTGQGQSFLFQPAEAGTYTVDLSAAIGGQGLAPATPLSIDVSEPSYMVTISRPSQPVGGHAASFAAMISPTPAQAITYDWSVSSSYYGANSPINATTPAFHFTPAFDGTTGDAANNYLITLTVTIGNQVITSTQSITTVADSASSAFTYTATDLNKILDGQSIANYALGQYGSAMAIQPDGKFVQAGYYGGDIVYPDLVDSFVVAVVRYRPDLTLDPSFGDGTGIVALPPEEGGGSGFFPQIQVAVAPGGDIVVIEGTVERDNTTQFLVVRLMPNGHLDQSFGSGGIDEIQSPIGPGPHLVAVQVLADNSILIGGEVITFIPAQGNTPDLQLDQWFLAKLQGSGDLDQTFGLSNESANNDGIIVFPGVSAPYLTNMGTGPSQYSLQYIAQEPNGDIVLSGILPISNGVQDPAIARLLPNGNLDPSFGGFEDPLNQIPATPGFVFSRSIGVIDGMVVQADGKIVISGVNWTGAEYDLDLIRYDTDGTPDQGFGEAQTGIVETGISATTVPPSAMGGLAEDDAGNLVISVDGLFSVWDLVRYTATGLLDTTFGTSSDGTVSLSFLNQPSGGDVIATPDGIVAVGNAFFGPDHDLDNFVIVRYRAPYASASNLEASVLGNNDVALQWINTGDSTPDGIVIKRSIDNGGPLNWIDLADVPADQTTYLDTTTAPDTPYDYEVVPFVGSTSLNQPVQLQGPSNIVPVTTAPLNTGYVQVDSVAVPVNSQTGVSSNIQLIANQPYLISVSGFFSIDQVDGKMGDAEYGRFIPTPDLFSAVGTIVKFGLGINDPDLGMTLSPYWGPPSTTTDHEYTILYTPTTNGTIALNYHDNYYPDNQSGTPLLVSIYRALPSSPGNVTAMPNRPEKQIDLAWSNFANDATSILVQRASINGIYQTIATLPATATSYSDPSAAFNQEYSYQVRAENSFGQSTPSTAAYAILINLPPLMPLIPAQIAHVGTNFAFDVTATDPEDGQRGLVYSIVDTSHTPGLVPVAGSPGAFGGWIPSSSQLGQSIQLDVRVADQDSTLASPSFTDQFVTVTVEPDLSTIPQVTGTTANLDYSSNATKVDLSASVSYSGSASNLIYTWTLVTNLPPGIMAPTFESNGTNAASTTIADLHGSGIYIFQVSVSDPSVPSTVTWPGVAVTAGVIVSSQITSLAITPASPTVGVGAATELTASVLDQFGHAFVLGVSDPLFSWEVTDSIAGGLVNGSSDSGSAIYNAPVSASWAPSTTKIDTVQAEFSWNTFLGPQSLSATAAVSVTNSGHPAPQLVTAANAVPVNSHQFRLTALGSSPNELESALVYHWEAIPLTPGLPLPQFSDNDSNSAKTTLATFPPNTDINYAFTVTITDQLGQIVQSTKEIADNPVFSQIAITPQQSSVGLGLTQTYIAIAEDQYGLPLANQSGFNFQFKTENGAVVQDGPSTTYVYTGQAVGPHTISVSVDGFASVPSAIAKVTVIGQGPPIMQIVSPAGSADGSAEVINTDVPVDIISYNPDGDPAPWALWLVANIGSGDGISGPTLLANSNSSTNSDGSPLLAITLSPTKFVDGSYTLVLTSSVIAATTDVRDQKSIKITTEQPAEQEYGAIATATSPTTVQLLWSITPGAIYNVYRGTTPSFIMNADTLVASGLSNTEFDDSQNLSPSTTYFYKVTYVINSFESWSSVGDSVTMPALPGNNSTSGQLIIDDVDGGAIQITWNDDLSYTIDALAPDGSITSTADFGGGGLIASPMDSAATAPTTAPTTQDTKAYWIGLALTNAHIDPRLWKPADGYLNGTTTKNVDIVQAVYDYYQRLYDRNRNLIWAGMARMAGGPLVRALSQAETIVLEGATGTGFVGQIAGWPGGAGVAVLANRVQVELLTMQQEIFFDLAWQHEAYLAGGLKEMTALYDAGELTQDAYYAWQEIDSGISTNNNYVLWHGNELLLRREQEVVLDRGYTAISKLPLVPTIMNYLVENPSAIVGGTGFDGADFTEFSDRWTWLVNDVVQPWFDTDQATRDYYIDQPFNDLIDGF
jgi:uncharacterized delta-60 repeat protein